MRTLDECVQERARVCVCVNRRRMLKCRAPHTYAGQSYATECKQDVKQKHRNTMRHKITKRMVGQWKKAKRKNRMLEKKKVGSDLVDVRLHEEMVKFCMRFIIIRAQWHLACLKSQLKYKRLCVEITSKMRSTSITLCAFLFSFHRYSSELDGVFFFHRLLLKFEYMQCIAARVSFNMYSVLFTHK